MTDKIFDTPLETTAADFALCEQRLHVAATWGEDAAFRVTQASADNPEKVGYYARCTAHFANIDLSMKKFGVGDPALNGDPLSG